MDRVRRPRAARRDVEADHLLDRLVAPGGMRAVFQPIVRIADGEIVGYEALCRAVRRERCEPGDWFALASQLGRRIELERACLRAIAKEGAPPGDTLLFVNVSPALLAHADSVPLRDRLPRRLVLELTEREEIDDVAKLKADLSPWLRTGARLAIDDAGAGYSSLKQVVELLPEFVKVDRSLIADIHLDRHRQALVAALAGFASEIGANLIAEGIESRAELAWLRDAEVGLAQGYLLARPGSPWPSVTTFAVRPTPDPRLERLVERLEGVQTRRAACEVVAAHLFRRGGLLPSVYLEVGGRLRCQAQRGLWQVLDGMEPTAGVTGLTFRTGEEQHLDDLSAAPDYLEAIPGVVAELCVPLRTDDEVVGALNVESVVPMAGAVLDEVRACAELLGRRLRDLQPELARVPLRRLAHTAASLATVEDAERTIDAVLAAATELSTMASAMLVVDDEWTDGEHRHATGPLADALTAMTHAELDHLRQVLGPLTSCYSAGDATGRTVTASEALREVGARALVALPITARGRRSGLLLLTHPEPVPLGPDQIEPLELLAVLAGSCLETAATVEELRRTARRDALTGLGNHSSFHERLRDLGAEREVAIVVLDIDRFKQVNDTGGHLLGDQVLRGISAGLRSAVPEADTPYRIGGDEFALVVTGPRSSRGPIRSLTDAVERAVGPLLAAHGAGISIGVAHRREGEALISTLERADGRLYQAKASRPWAFRSSPRAAAAAEPTL